MKKFLIIFWLLFSTLIFSADKWLIAPSVLFDCWNYRIFTDNPKLLERVKWQQAAVGGNCERIVADGWHHNRPESRNQKIMVLPYIDGKLNKEEYSKALTQHLKLNKKYRIKTVIDIFMMPYKDWAQYMSFPALFESDDKTMAKRAEYVNFLLDIGRKYDVIWSIGNELTCPGGNPPSSPLVEKIKSAGIPAQRISQNLILHVQTIEILLNRKIKFENMQIGYAYTFWTKESSDEGNWLKADLDRYFGPKYHIDLGTTIRRTGHGFGVVDLNLQNFITWFGGSSTKWFLDNDGKVDGHSTIDCTIDPVTKIKDCKPSRDEQRDVMSWLVDGKRNPATKIWGFSSINEGIWKDAMPVPEAFVDLIKSGMLGSTQGIVDEYIKHFGKPKNMKRFAKKEFVYVGK